MARIPIALQLYSVREDCARDFEGTVRAVAAMGYDGVDFAGYYDWSAEDLRKLLDDCGLKVAGTHTAIQTLLGDELERTIEFHRTIGNQFLIVPGLPGQYTESIEAWRRTADVFNEISGKLRAAGMYTGYHNHHTEFQAVGGEVPWDVLFGNTVAEVVMQVDTGNMMHGGADPVHYLRKYPGRALTVHLKEYSETNDKAVVGEGDCPWDDVFELCESTGGTQWYIVEQESYAYPPLECVKICLENLREMGK